MIKKNGNFFEEHVEKITLAVMALICMWLFLSRVIISPNHVEYAGENFGPSEIDDYIAEQAELLREKLVGKPEAKDSYKRQLDDFMSLVNSGVGDLDTGICPHIPRNTSKEAVVKSKYHIPAIGKVADVAAERIRAVAYIPIGVVDQENPYIEGNSEPNDIDLVTIEAKIDVAGLYERFYESYAGNNVKEPWRDPCLAKPVFAAVQLERQELGEYGNWGGWRVIGKSNIQGNTDILEVIEDIKGLPAGGMKVRRLQFSNLDVQRDILQPQAYRIGSVEEDWFPPTLHKEFISEQVRIKVRERQERQGTERRERQEELRQARRDRSRGREDSRTATGTGGAGGFGGMMDSPVSYAQPSTGRSGTTRSGTAGRTSERARRRADRRRQESAKEKPEKTEAAKDIYAEFDKIVITEETDIARMTEPLLFWAHDDTVEANKSYRYRIRFGVFNPVAGSNQFFEADMSHKNNVVLWSDFSDITEVVEIPARLYFFPINVQETIKAVTVQVSKYVMGYWRSENFTVKQGEVIGRVVENEPEERDKIEDKEVVSNEPESIDYGTEKVMVDVVPVNCWSSGKNVRPRYYFEMLYSSDGGSIKHTAIKQSNWPKNMLAKFNDIKKTQKYPHQELRPWGSRGDSYLRRSRPGEMYDSGMDDMQLMMDDMMAEPARRR